MESGDRLSEKRLYCRNQSKDGRICVLYSNHYGDHKEKHLKSSWGDGE